MRGRRNHGADLGTLGLALRDWPEPSVKLARELPPQLLPLVRHMGSSARLLLVVLLASTGDSSSPQEGRQASPRGASCGPVCGASGPRLRGGEDLESGAGRRGGEDGAPRPWHPDVVRPLVSDSEVPRAGAGGYAAAKEVYSIATEGLGDVDVLGQSAESVLPVSDDDSLDSDDPIRRVSPAPHPP